MASFDVGYSGTDMAFVAAIEDKDAEGSQEGEVYDYDEYRQIQKCVFRTSPESAYRLLGAPIVRLSHTVVELPVHGVAGETIAFVEGLEEVAANAYISGRRKSKLQAFFDLSYEYLRTHRERLPLTYLELPSAFWWNVKGRKWLPYQRDRRERTLGRVLSVAPTRPELVAIRHLLLAVKGPTAFLDLRTVTMPDGTIRTCATFTEAAQQLGLMEDAERWIQTVKDASVEFKNSKRYCCLKNQIRRYGLGFAVSSPA